VGPGDDPEVSGRSNDLILLIVLVELQRGLGGRGLPPKTSLSNQKEPGGGGKMLSSVRNLTSPTRLEITYARGGLGTVLLGETYEMENVSQAYKRKNYGREKNSKKPDKQEKSI